MNQISQSINEEKTFTCIVRFEIASSCRPTYRKGKICDGPTSDNDDGVKHCLFVGRRFILVLLREKKKWRRNEAMYRLWSNVFDESFQVYENISLALFFSRQCCMRLWINVMCCYCFFILINESYISMFENDSFPTSFSLSLARALFFFPSGLFFFFTSRVITFFFRFQRKVTK